MYSTVHKHCFQVPSFNFGLTPPFPAIIEPSPRKSACKHGLAYNSYWNTKLFKLINKLINEAHKRLHHRIGQRESDSQLVLVCYRVRDTSTQPTAWLFLHNDNTCPCMSDWVIADVAFHWGAVVQNTLNTSSWSNVVFVCRDHGSPPHFHFGSFPEMNGFMFSKSKSNNYILKSNPNLKTIPCLNPNSYHFY